MATVDGGQAPIELSSSDSESSSHLSSGHHRRPAVCPWRTRRFWDQECERYFDCPSHHIVRAPTDHDEDENRRQDPQDVAHEDGEQHAHAGSGSISPVSEDDDEGGRGVPSPPSPSISPAQQAPAGSAENPIILVDDDEPAQADNRLTPPVSRPADDGNWVPQSLPRTTPTPGASRVDLTAVAGPLSASPTSSPTGLLPGSASGTAGHGSQGQLVLPRWQPDAEATYCYNCQSQFSIFVRKHHCRKCGRVVCAACSPHRITIPYQYIVQPPGMPRLIPQRYPPGPESGYPDFGVVGGGERVRLCNPCVPDPNTAPPGLPQTQAQQGSHVRSHSNLPGSFPSNPSPAASSHGWSSYFGAAPANDTHARSRSVTMHSTTASSSSRPSNGQYNSTQASLENRILSGTPPYYRPATTAQRQQLYPGMATTRYHSMIDMGERAGPSSSSSSSAAGPSSSTDTNRRLPPLPPPPPQIAEEDECPVCHRELPPRTLPNFESLREAHINICITSHSTYSGGSPTAPGGNAGSGANGSPLPPVPPRRTGMFPYVATEKDCVDSAECSICLEEFEVGVPMARLECLCRFHRSCISAWWERHPGRCPMHQHDSFGY
ncbi:FYVE zinc finger-domain-containing protein [Cercophora scortea]|uniref:RING-type E3 ubiquitin transferase n=1 Tax=Cercophora scortea TaxID=314031 RepID=A0AAE0J581_9PEZI|nr:FYVE zinc finger-domain-containing protein [Cercophora scortea]